MKAFIGEREWTSSAVPGHLPNSHLGTWDKSSSFVYTFCLFQEIFFIIKVFDSLTFVSFPFHFYFLSVFISYFLITSLIIYYLIFLSILPFFFLRSKCYSNVNKRLLMFQNPKIITLLDGWPKLLMECKVWNQQCYFQNLETLDCTFV